MMLQHLLIHSLIIISLGLQLVLAGDGKWSEWNGWTECSVTCGEGMQRRYRACDNPPPTAGGKWCPGMIRDARSCEGPSSCPVNGGWSNWSQWSACSVTCGQGQRRRVRTCDQPVPLFAGDNCEGNSVDSESCTNLEECPRDGGWSLWSTWSHCSVTCGMGSKQKFRECSNPPPAADGLPCVGKSSISKACDSELNCPVNGQWSEWSHWTPCSATCGEGQRRRVRTCDNPPAQYGGKPCSIIFHGHIDVQQCRAPISHCAVNGAWSEWGVWGPCETAECHEDRSIAFAYRQRSCNSPLPRYGGSMCSGSFLDAGICSQPTNCKRNGGWGGWSVWICTDDEARRTRSCDNPIPSNGGEPCPIGPAVEFYTRADQKDNFNLVCEIEEPDEDQDQPLYGGEYEEEVKDDEEEPNYNY